jgi:hypothetical protein
MPHRDRRAGGLLSFSLALGLCWGTPAALACGYHDPATIALGLLNWTYPNALYLRTAAWQAKDAGVLPPRWKGLQKDLFAFHRAAAAMQDFGRRILTQPLAGVSAQSFSVVLLESQLWTGFARGENGITVDVHADGPRQGDVVVVTDIKVVRAMLDDALPFAAAEAHGLLRFYGDAASREAVRAQFATFDRESGPDRE